MATATNKIPIKHDRDLKWVDVDKVIKNEKNPRRAGSFSPESLTALRKSIGRLGVLEPIIVQPYDDDMYLLLEGERRWTTAKLEGIKSLPAVVVNKMDEHDQVVVMYNIHAQRKGWEMVEELEAIRELMEQNGHLSEEQMAEELAMSVGTFKDRLRVLGMAPEVHRDLATGDLDYTSALRSSQVASSLAKKRPTLAEKLGGPKAIEKRLIKKAKVRKGISQELVSARQDLTDVEHVPDSVVEKYLTEPEASLRDVRKKAESLEERRKVESLHKELKQVERSIRSFRIDLAAAPNLKQLRGTLASLIDAAQSLEERVVEALLDEEEPSQ